MTSARRAFAAHPDAITDLRELPEPIRDQALLHLQDLVHGEHVATRLEGRLEGFHKVMLGVGSDWATHRLVVQFRPAPAASKHDREVYLVAAGPRANYAVYRTAQLRTGRNQTPPPDPANAARIRAAHARSPDAGSLTASEQATPTAHSTSTPVDTRKAVRWPPAPHARSIPSSSPRAVTPSWPAAREPRPQHR